MGRPDPPVLGYHHLNPSSRAFSIGITVTISICVHRRFPELCGGRTLRLARHVRAGRSACLVYRIHLLRHQRTGPLDEAILPEDGRRASRLSRFSRPSTGTNGAELPVAADLEIGLWAGSVYVPSAISQVAIRDGFSAPDAARVASWRTMLLALGTILACIGIPLPANRSGRRGAVASFFALKCHVIRICVLPAARGTMGVYSLPVLCRGGRGQLRRLYVVDSGAVPDGMPRQRLLPWRHAWGGSWLP